MSEFKFKVLMLESCTAREWVQMWADQYPSDDESEYEHLVSNYTRPSSEYFVRIGKWKDRAETENRWRPNVASVAYKTWMVAAEKLPRCPPEDSLVQFLEDWSNRKAAYNFRNGNMQERRFGLSRATTLLHFISGGKYPIFDSRVRTALTRLCSPPPAADATPGNYVKVYCPLITKLAIDCGVENEPRTLDKALFSYGSSKSWSYNIPPDL